MPLGLVDSACITSVIDCLHCQELESASPWAYKTAIEAAAEILANTYCGLAPSPEGTRASVGDFREIQRCLKLRPDGSLSFDSLLAKAEPIIIRDQRQQLDWLAQGKISILIAPKPDVFTEFVGVGAPVALVEPVEGNWLSSGVGVIALFNRAPHPNAAKVFLNWLLSREGQTLFFRQILQQSARLDVSTASLPPDLIRQPGAKYFPVGDEAGLARRLVTDKLAKELFGSIVKK